MKRLPPDHTERFSQGRFTEKEDRPVSIVLYCTVPTGHGGVYTADYGLGLPVYDKQDVAPIRRPRLPGKAET